MCETRQIARECGCNCLRVYAREATRKAQVFLAVCAFCVIATYASDILRAIFWTEIAVFAGLASVIGWRVYRAWRRWQLARSAIPAPLPDQPMWTMVTGVTVRAINSARPSTTPATGHPIRVAARR